MNKKTAGFVTFLIFLITAGLITVLFLRGGELFQPQSKKQWQTRMAPR